MGESSVRCDSSVDHFGFGDTIVGESMNSSLTGSGAGFGCGSLLLRFGIRISALRARFSASSFAATSAAAARILACASFSGRGAKDGRAGDSIAGDVFERWRFKRYGLGDGSLAREGVDGNNENAGLFA